MSAAFRLTAVCALALVGAPGDRGAIRLAASAGSADPQRTAKPASEPPLFGLGRPATAAEIAAWDIDVGPDGAGLPPGRGTPAEGAKIYAARCAMCHGRTGREGPYDPLAGRPPGSAFITPHDPRDPRTIGSYWPYATTLFDYIRRAMPPDQPGSLRDGEVYAVVAYLLFLNELVQAEAVIDAASLPQVVMPARDRFVPDSRRQPKPAPRR